MTAIVILNIVFAVLVVGGIVGLLGRAIIADHPGAWRRQRQPVAAKPTRIALRRALDFGR